MPKSNWQPRVARKLNIPYCLSCGAKIEPGKIVLMRFERDPELGITTVETVCDEVCLVDYREGELLYELRRIT